MDSSKLFVPDEIISLMLKCINLDFDLMRLNYQLERDCLLADFEEVHAFWGFKKAKHLISDELWITDGTAYV